MKIEYKQMNELVPGDKIIGSDGKPTVVTEVFEEHIPKRMYQMEMEDGQIIECSGNHLWYCETDTDKKEQKKYKKAAKRFFKRNEIPDYDALYPSYPLEIMKTKFSDNKKDMEFIERVCLSLGPSVATPNVIFDGYMEVVEEDLVYTYSFNDMINFLHILKDSVMGSKNSYFYFGKVRTTDEIFSIIGENINIPERGDISNGKR